MADNTKIEWTDASWNPVTGCTKISTGCKHCYAERMSKRLSGRFGYPEAPHNFDVTLHPERLNEPLKWRKPRRVFVFSMGDLFHEDVPLTFIVRVFNVMASVNRHTFQILTKRPERMLVFFNWYAKCTRDVPGYPNLKFPLPNIWLGVTAENQEQADKQITILLQIPAAVRFVSVEPMLDKIELPYYDQFYSPDGFENNGPMYRTIGRADEPDSPIDWVICGAETGPGKRPMELDWARSLRDQCKAAGVPFFFKKDSDGNHTLDGVVYEEFPQ